MTVILQVNGHSWSCFCFLLSLSFIVVFVLVSRRLSCRRFVLFYCSFVCLLSFHFYGGKLTWRRSAGEENGKIDVSGFDPSSNDEKDRKEGRAERKEKKRKEKKTIRSVGVFF